MTKDTKYLEAEHCLHCVVSEAVRKFLESHTTYNLDEALQDLIVVIAAIIVDGYKPNNDENNLSEISSAMRQTLKAFHQQLKRRTPESTHKH
jgi:protein-tyrosine phosphatase